MNPKAWLSLFLIMYSFLVSIMCFIFYMMNIFFTNQLFNYNWNFYSKISIMINFLSLGGLPPFLGFFSKWMVINFMIMNNFILTILFFTCMSLIMIFIYIRIIYSSLLFYSMKLKWFKMNIKNNYFFIINLTSLISLTGMIFSTLIMI